MHQAVRVLHDVYFDSVILMGAAARAKSNPAISEAAFFMGSAANKQMLAGVGFTSVAIDAAGPGDAVLAVGATVAQAAEAAISDAVAALMGKKGGAEAGEAGRARPRGLSAALRDAGSMGGANLVFLSLPGRYVESEAMRALKRGLNVFIFSDNVPIASEVRLKSEAVARGLLCMGPDCGTAWIGGAGLGFCNEVPPGRVGIISASGTGLQTVACLLAAAGEGISHGIGVGGRDLSLEVGGLMTLQALRMLDADAATKAIIIISKPPAAETMARLESALASVGKPVVVACLGAPERESERAVWVSTLAGAVEAMLARLQGRARTRAAFSDPQGAKAVAARHADKAGRPLLGLYTGGTLAHEAEIVLQSLLGAIAYGDERAICEGRHCILDLGDDQYTQGRPHPMIDPSPRADYLLRYGASAGVVLFDLVLGRCSHADPASPLVAAMHRLQTQAGESTPVFVGSVVGTTGDGQGLARQSELLREAGAVLLPDNAEAARLAALILGSDAGMAQFGA